jgi:hypothetical protein
VGTAQVFDALMQAREDMPPPGVGAMWITNFAKRLLESSKVDVAIKEAQSALERGRFPIIFIETKAERILDIPDLIEKERKYNIIAAQAKARKEKPPPRKEFGLPPKGIVPILAKVMETTGEKIIHIQPAEERIQDAFGADDVAIYTGSVSGTKAQENLAKWREQGQPRVMVATMAKGGTGLSLHDKVGDHQTTQININLPWNATGVVQVTQRSARYGMQGKAEIMWLFAENVAMDRWLAKRVGARMQDMGAIVHGEVLEGSKEIEDWNFDDQIVSEDGGGELASYDDESGELGSYRDIKDDEGDTDQDTDDTADDENEGQGDDPDKEEQEDDEEGDEDEPPPPAPKTYYDKPPSGPAAHPETGEPLHGLGLTELVELSKELLGLPKVVARFRKLGQLGVFRYAGAKAGIKIHADLFKEGRERELAQVLAHEIGHLADWLPEKDLRRGNLLGHLFSLHKFLAHTFIKPNGDIVEMNDIKPELTRVTDLWRPYNKELADAKFKAYRNSSVELIADSLSALLTDPEFLQRNAPNFYREFIEALDRKPEVKKAYEAMQAVMQLTPEQRAERRVERDIERRKAGSARAVAWEKEKIQKLKDARWKNWMLRLKSEYLDKHAPVIDRVKALAARGIEMAEHLNPRYLLQERNYVGGKVRGWVSRNVRPLVERLEAHGIDWNDFGGFLEYDRSIKGDYMEKAAGGGRTPATATADYEALASKYTPEQMKVVEDSMERFRVSVAEVVKDAYKAGLYTPELYTQFKNNPAYATFRGIDFIEKNVTAYVHHAKGSFQDVTNAADSTILKMMVTIRETQNQLAKRSTFDMLQEHFPEDIEKARRTGPKSSDFARPENADLKEVGYFDHGVWQRMYVDPLIANSLNNESVGHNWVVMQAINYVNSKVFRPLFVGYNPGFMSFNVVRDFLRTWKNYNDDGKQLSLAGAVKRYRQSHAIAKVRAFGVPKNATAKENAAWSDLTAAEEHFIFGLSFASGHEREVQETEIKDIMARVGVIDAEGPPRTGWRKSVGPILDFLNWMEKVGNYVETLPKAAAMYEMLGDDKRISDLTPRKDRHARHPRRWHAQTHHERAVPVLQHHHAGLESRPERRSSRHREPAPREVGRQRRSEDTVWLGLEDGRAQCCTEDADDDGGGGADGRRAEEAVRTRQ